jgi:hypothetical protein
MHFWLEYSSRAGMTLFATSSKAGPYTVRLDGSLPIRAQKMARRYRACRSFIAITKHFDNQSVIVMAADDRLPSRKCRIGLRIYVNSISNAGGSSSACGSSSHRRVADNANVVFVFLSDYYEPIEARFDCFRSSVADRNLLSSDCAT